MILYGLTRIVMLSMVGMVTTLSLLSHCGLNRSTWMEDLATINFLADPQTIGLTEVWEPTPWPAAEATTPTPLMILVMS